MSNSTKRFIIVFMLLIVTALITFNAYSTKKHSGLLYTSNIPMNIGNWYGRELVMDERTYDILETKDAVMIEYTNPNNESIILTIVFSQNNRKVSHPPEVCFVGSGWSRTSRESEEIDINGYKVKVNKLVLRREPFEQYVIYLYKSGSRFTANYYAQQFNIILNGMLRRDTSSALIRISSYVSERDDRKVKALAEAFLKETLPILSKILP